MRYTFAFLAAFSLGILLFHNYPEYFQLTFPATDGRLAWERFLMSWGGWAGVILFFILVNFFLRTKKKINSEEWLPPEEEGQRPLDVLTEEKITRKPGNRKDTNEKN